jgi:SAM-dependent methyltransferase
MTLWSTVRRSLGRVLPDPVKRLVRRALWAAADWPEARRWRARGWRVPPRALRRTHPGVAWFIESGACARRDLSDALRMVDCAFADFDCVLDFGCGSGRILQHLCRAHPCRFFGCDVDPAAVRWAGRNLPRADLRVSPPMPPLPYEPDSFDLVIAVSVFTHLPESAQLAWLGELRRVLRPGGLALVTVTGCYALGHQRQRPDTLSDDQKLAMVSDDELEREGLVYTEYPWVGSGGGRARRRGIEGSYGLARHSHAYIRKTWPTYLDVLDILPGALGDVQDITILRRRSLSV